MIPTLPPRHTTKLYLLAYFLLGVVCYNALEQLWWSQHVSPNFFEFSDLCLPKKCELSSLYFLLNWSFLQAFPDSSTVHKLTWSRRELGTQRWWHRCPNPRGRCTVSPHSSRGAPCPCQTCACAAEAPLAHARWSPCTRTSCGLTLRADCLLLYRSH